MKRLTTKLLAIGLSISMVIPMGANVFAEEEKKLSFDEWMELEYKESLESDYLGFHYTLKDNEKYGIEKPEVTLGTISFDEKEENIKELEDTINELHSYDYDTLSDVQKHDYDTYAFYLKNALDMERVCEYQTFYSPSEGIQSGLLSNFTEFIFYTKEDVKDYLTLLADVPTYMESALDLTKEQAEKGFFLTDRQVDQTVDAMEKFATKKEDNPLIVIFNKRVEELKGLSKDEIKEFEKLNADLVTGLIQPTYAQIADELNELKGSRASKGGYASFGEDGKAYYEVLAHVKSSSSLSVEQQFLNCSSYMIVLLEDLIDIYQNADYDIDAAFEEELVGMDTPDAILEYLKAHMQDYPKGPLVHYNYSYLDESVANDSTVAYYMQPPVDDFKDNVIRINKFNIQDENTLYETLAHEGYPGHLYQITWYLNTNPNLLRTLLSNIGYAEGWAMYTEIHSWYTSPLKEDVAKLHGILTALNYVQDAAIDLAVNGLNYSEKEVSEWLNAMGLVDDGAEEMVQFAIDNPGLLLPYGGGLMRFFELERTAKASLKENYSQLEFNRVLLTNGDRPFELVETDVKNYIESKGATVVDPDEEIKETIEEEERAESSEKVVTAATIILIIAVAFWLINRRYRKGDPFEA